MKIDLNELCVESQAAQRFIIALREFQDAHEVIIINDWPDVVSTMRYAASRIERARLRHEETARALHGALKDFINYQPS
jgi:hypothetical protein